MAFEIPGWGGETIIGTFLWCYDNGFGHNSKTSSYSRVQVVFIELVCIALLVLRRRPVVRRSVSGEKRSDHWIRLPAPKSLVMDSMLRSFGPLYVLSGSHH